MQLTWTRAACVNPVLCGVSRADFGELLEELAPKWQAGRESELRERRGGDRRWAAGAGPKRRLDEVPRLRLVVIADDQAGPRLCPGCGVPLMPSAKATAVFCKAACRSRHWWRMRQVRARTEAVQAGVTIACPQCGESWTAGVDRLVSALYCSPACRKRAWHTRHTQPGGT